MKFIDKYNEEWNKIEMKDNSSAQNIFNNMDYNLEIN
jgi:hypothetical protein